MLKEFYQKYIELNLKDYAYIDVDFEINKALFFVFLALIVAAVFISYLQSTLALMVKKLIRTLSFDESKAKKLSDLGLDKNRMLKFALTRPSGSISLIIREAGKKKPTYEEYLTAENAEREIKKSKREAKREKRTSVFSELKKLDSVQIQPTSDEQNKLAVSIDSLNQAEEALQVTESEAVSGEAAPRTSAKQLLSGTKPDFDSARFYIPKDMEERALRYYNAKQGSITKTVLACLGLFACYILLALLMPTVLTYINDTIRSQVW